MSKRGIINLTIIVYCLIGLAIYHFHEKWLFKPNSVKVEYQLPYEWKNIDIPISQQTSMHLLQIHPTDSAKGVVIYFGGIQGNVWSQKSSYQNIPAHGYEVIAMDYPGYGTSIGKFTEDSVYFRAITTYTFARARYQPDQIILMGEELGAAVATYIATKKDVKSVLLINPISHYKDYISLKIYPLERMLNYKFPTRDYINDLIAPVYIIDNNNDIPNWMKQYKNLKSISTVEEILSEK